MKTSVAKVQKIIDERRVMESYKKKIYPEGYEKIIREFKSKVLCYDGYCLKTDYNGWSALYDVIKNECSMIEYGNLSYFIDCSSSFSCGKFKEIVFNLTDETADEEYTNRHYIMTVKQENGKFVKNITKQSVPYYAKIDKNHINTNLNSYDFAIFCNHFLVLTRNDNDNLYYLFCFGKCPEKRISFLQDCLKEKVKLQKGDLVKDLSYLYNERQFRSLKDTIKSEKIQKIKDDILKCFETQNFQKIQSYLSTDFAYTNFYSYGYETARLIVKHYKNMFSLVKEIVVVKSKISDTQILIALKLRENTERTRNVVILIDIDHEYRIKSISEPATFLYGINEYDDEVE